MSNVGVTTGRRRALPTRHQSDSLKSQRATDTAVVLRSSTECSAGAETWKGSHQNLPVTLATLFFRVSPLGTATPVPFEMPAAVTTPWCVGAATTQERAGLASKVSLWR
jgi:hypothetical protein